MGQESIPNSIWGDEGEPHSGDAVCSELELPIFDSSGVCMPVTHRPSHTLGPPSVSIPPIPPLCDDGDKFPRVPTWPLPCFNPHAPGSGKPTTVVMMPFLPLSSDAMWLGACPSQHLLLPLPPPPSDNFNLPPKGRSSNEVSPEASQLVRLAAEGRSPKVSKVNNPVPGEQTPVALTV